MKSQKLTTWISLAMTAGIIVGYLRNQMIPDPKTAKTVASYIARSRH